MPRHTLHANSTICGHKIMVVTGTITVLLLVSSTLSFVAINILTTSPLNVAALLLGMFCVATRGLEANHDVAMFLSSAQNYPDVKEPTVGLIQIVVISNGVVGVVIFFFAVIFLGDTIAVIFFPFFAFLVIKIVLDKRASKVHQPRVRVATTRVTPRFFENLPALIV